MAKRKGLSYEQKMLNALKKLPSPLIDNKHRLKIHFIDDRARSNQGRFDHIIVFRHGLTQSNIERIIEKINNSILKKDPERTDTYNLYIKRNNVGNKYIKMSLYIDFNKSNDAFVKTIFITTNLK